MSISTEFDALVDTYKQLLQACLDALSEDATPEQREKLRNALAQFLQRK